MEEEKKSGNGCLTIIIFLLNLATFGTGIAVFDAAFVPLICGEDTAQYDPTTFHWYTLLIMIALPIICLKLLYKGSRYLSEFICSFFKD